MSKVPHEIMNLLTSSRARDRRLAVEDLPTTMGMGALSLLVVALADPDTSVRETAIESLGVLKGAECCQMILPLLHSENACTRNSAMEVLARQGDDACPLILNEILIDTNPDIRKFGLDILKLNAAPIPALRQEIVLSARRLLDDANMNVAGAAAEVIGVHGSNSDIPVLLQHMERSLWLQCSIIAALQEMGSVEAGQALEALDSNRLDPLARRLLRRNSPRKIV